MVFNELIKQLKQNGVTEISFTLKFSDSADSASSIESQIDTTKVDNFKPTAKPEIPPEMLIGDL